MLWEFKLVAFFYQSPCQNVQYKNSELNSSQFRQINVYRKLIFEKKLKLYTEEAYTTRFFNSFGQFGPRICN